MLRTASPGVLSKHGTVSIENCHSWCSCSGTVRTASSGVLAQARSVLRTQGTVSVEKSTASPGVLAQERSVMRVGTSAAIFRPGLLWQARLVLRVGTYLVNFVRNNQ